MEEQMTKMMEMMTTMQEELVKLKSERVPSPALEPERPQQEASASTRPTTSGASTVGTFGPKVDPPPKFAGKEEEWRMFSLKMRSFYGNYLEGQMGDWMDNVRDHREQDCRVDALGLLEAKKPAEMLYQGLVSFCEGDAFTIVENAGEGEGLEAWRSLYLRYDVQTRQSRVSQLMKLLYTDIRNDDVLNSLAKFERDWQRWESRSKKDWDELVNDLKIGVVLKGLEAGPMKTQLLLESEK